MILIYAYKIIPFPQKSASFFTALDVLDECSKKISVSPILLRLCGNIFLYG